MQVAVDNPVPTNVITGALGVGKTTFIEQLVKNKPSDERWAVLINEFGEVGIDGGLINIPEHHGVFVAEVPGGCMCCTAGLSMQIALNQLLARAKPHRLLIEPTGLGHPEEVLATLQAQHYQPLIEVRSTLTLVDARKVNQSSWRENSSYQQQMAVADIVIMSKRDLYSGVEQGYLRQYILPLSSKPLLVENVDINQWRNLLDAPCHFNATQSPQPAISLRRRSLDIGEKLASQDCIRLTNSGAGFTSFGWAFAPHKRFDLPKVLKVLGDISVNRLKAILITYQGIFAFNVVDDELTYQEIDESNDSRLEFISEQQLAAECLAQQLETSLFTFAD